MNLIKRFNCNVMKNDAEGLDIEIEWQLSLYSLHPNIQIIVISHSDVSVCFPHQVIHIASQTVREFALNPSEVVWVEHTASWGDGSSCATFNLISFDWHAGQAVSPHRSPIFEDWHLSWLRRDFATNDLDSKNDLDSTIRAIA